MQKTSVYLNDAEAEGLRRVAAITGLSQANLIRAGVQMVVADYESHPKTFRSLGRGRGGGKPYVAWDSSDLYKRAMGEQ